MALQCGIVGLPNVGKSTLFNALTKAGIAAENYPFCTIEPNVGIVEVPDERLQALASIVKPERVLPATVEFVDIAGLVAGASKGEGLGNKAFFAAIIGGFNNSRGALLGGLIVGVCENLAAAYVSPAYKDAVALAIFMVVILFKPQGLLGRKEERKV